MDTRIVIISAYVAVGAAMFIWTYGTDEECRAEFLSGTVGMMVAGTLFFLFCWPLLLLETGDE